MNLGSLRILLFEPLFFCVFLDQNSIFCPVGSERNPSRTGGTIVTNEQKQQIITLQIEGKGYRLIASELQLPINSVKSWCYRHPINSTESGHCLQCGAPVKQTPHRKEKKYCSDRCRALWWAAHPELRNAKKLYSHICVGCGQRFESNRAKRMYCSAASYAQNRNGGAHD